MNRRNESYVAQPFSRLVSFFLYLWTTQCFLHRFHHPSSILDVRQSRSLRFFFTFCNIATFICHRHRRACFHSYLLLVDILFFRISFAIGSFVCSDFTISWVCLFFNMFSPLREWRFHEAVHYEKKIDQSRTRHFSSPQTQHIFSPVSRLSFRPFYCNWISSIFFMCYNNNLKKINQKKKFQTTTTK